MEALASVLSLIMQPCYDLTGNWWAAILLFTIIVKIILMPMALWCQKNAIVMVQLMPDLNRLKIKYFGDSETIGEKQNELYKEKHYHPMLSLVPLAVQIIILFGLVDVIHSITDNGAPGTEFLGMVPFEDGGMSWIMPLFAGLSAVIMGFAQNRINPLQREQSRLEKNTTNGLSIALSFVLGVFVAAGMAFYWVCSNLTSIVVQALCNVIIKPRKYIDYQDLNTTRDELEMLNSLSKKTTKWYQRDPLAKREKQDYKRFFKIVDKHLVFYSEKSGFYKYFEGAIQWLLANSDMRIHYVTNDPNDQVFELAKQQPRIFPYYISEKKAITLLMKMDADVVAATLEDFDNFYLKRSYVRDDTVYAFFFHHATSSHMTPHEDAFDHYDAILCAGPHQVAEIRAAEAYRGLPPKTLVEYGYDLIDQETATYNAMAHPPKSRPVILIGPSWQEDNILDSCIDPMLGQLLGQGWHIIVRPHPEYTKRYRARWDALKQRYSSVSPAELSFDEDFSSNDSIFEADVLITDWSSISCDFSFSTLKPTLFVDTPMKVGNPHWEALGLPATDITLRNEIGRSFAPQAMEGFGDTVADMVEHADRWRNQIAEVKESFLFHNGDSARYAGEFLLETVLAQQAKRAQASAPRCSHGHRSSQKQPTRRAEKRGSHASQAVAQLAGEGSGGSQRSSSLTSGQEVSCG